MTFSKEQIEALKAPLVSKHVRERKQAGRALSYIEAWHAIAEANRIFGFDYWDRETVECRCVSERERTDKPGFRVSYVARVRIRIWSPGATFDESHYITREGTGAGHGIDADLGLAHESAIKEAESDAMKRALMTFGNPFGLALYDKEQANVVDEPPPSAQPEDSRTSSQRMADELIAEVNACRTAARVRKLEAHPEFIAMLNACDRLDQGLVEAAISARAADLLREQAA